MHSEHATINYPNTKWREMVIQDKEDLEQYKTSAISLQKQKT